VVRSLRDAGAPHVVASDHPDIDLHGWFDVADVLITDVSSVASDFMVTERPYLITNPRGIDPAVFQAEFVSCAGAALLDPTGANLIPELLEAFGEDPRRTARMETARRVLGEHPDGAQASFAEAVDAVLAEAEQARQRVGSTFSFR
jgi:CDP-glycerol glycerophosphotransferase (TagB/SpsB family)